VAEEERSKRLGSKVLVVVAHPDDVDFAAAGTIALWRRNSAAITYCMVTSGELGGADPDCPPEKMAVTRRAEQTAAAHVLGVTDIRFLGYPDGEVAATARLRRDICRVIREVRPDRLVTHSPEIAWEFLVVSHPDHRATGEAAISAAYPDATNPRAHPLLRRDEGLGPWHVPELWIMGSPHPNHFVDITDVFELKLAALGSHASQGVLDAPEAAARLRQRQGSVAAHGGLPHDRLAEPFQVVRSGNLG
jgi:LmbE family N-acetylglucosaminyl deacetylase